MKIRGFLAILLLCVVVAYFVYFAKSGGKTNLKTEVDQFVRTKIELTRANLATLEGVITGFVASEGRAPADLAELQRLQPATTGLIDAWGREIKYEKISDSSFRLISAGPDGTFGTTDDIRREY
jgi:hypothetical protein